MRESVVPASNVPRPAQEARHADSALVHRTLQPAQIRIEAALLRTVVGQKHDQRVALQIQLLQLPSNRPVL